MQRINKATFMTVTGDFEVAGGGYDNNTPRPPVSGRFVLLAIYGQRLGPNATDNQALQRLTVPAPRSSSVSPPAISTPTDSEVQIYTVSRTLPPIFVLLSSPPVSPCAGRRTRTYV